MARSASAQAIRQTSAMPPGVRGRLAFFTATHLVDDVYQGAVPALLPFLALERHYTYAGLTGITLAATFLSSVVQPGFGALTDKYRHLGWLTAVGLLTAGLGIGVSGLGDNYAITWIAVAVAGIGVAAYHPEMTRIARGIAGDSTQAMSWFTVGGNAGLALGPVLVAPVLLATRLHGTPLLAIPAVITAIALAIRRPWRQAAASGKRSATPRAEDQRDDWHGFMRLAAVAALRSVTYFGLASLIALFMIRHFHQSTTVGSAALTTFTGTGIIGTIGGGWLADRWQRIGTIRLGYVLTAPCVLLLALAPNVTVAFIVAVLLGIALFTPFVTQVTLGQDYLPNRIGTASGVTLGLAISVGGLATPLFGWLADSRGLTTALAALAFFPAASLALSFGLRDPRARAML